ncbi:ATP-binding protein [Corynebacterium cystitidis]|uniref:ATP-binding protein n=1 Tax=Corynebacterium cystitidis TaxID=35757 RepID=UPI00211E3274|nr:ATP-binding protein [Corynebacterium cystitidis]
MTDPAYVRIITGVRRCGKSTLLELYRRHLINTGTSDDAIFVINFEDHSDAPLRDPDAFHNHVRDAINAGVRYLHVDEVQELDGWAGVINSLRLDPELEICVTGSNASLFVGESLTYLAGRYIEIPMLPLPQPHTTHPRPTISGMDAHRWFSRHGAADRPGSDPPGQHVPIRFDLHPRHLTAWPNPRHGNVPPRRPLHLRQRRLPSGNPSHSHHLKQEGFTASSETINRYLALMSDARLIYQCRDYDTKSKRWLSTNGKFYFVDPGLRTALLGSRTFNLGDDLENMVYLELRRRGFHVSTGTVPRGEIDFIATKDSLQLHIQVALTASDEGTLRRELAPFKTLDAGSRCLLLTTDRFSPDTGAVDWCDAIAFLNGAPLPGEDSHR